MMRFSAVRACCAAFVVAMSARCGAIDLSRESWTVPSWDPRLTQPGAVLEYVDKTWCGHVQGMCVSSNALYFAFHTHILKTDWLGRLPPQALVQFAELKDGKIRDISRHCIFRTPIDR